MSIPAKEADVVIIGGGLIGCAAAYYLAKRALKAVVVEKGNISCEGSGTTFGAIRTFGKNPVEIPLTLKSTEMWKTLSAELNCEVGYVQEGGLYIAETEDELEPLEQYAEGTHQEEKLDCRIIGPSEIKTLIPLLEMPMAGALYSPSSGWAERVVPARCFADAARKLGTQIHTETLCVGMEVSGGKVSGVRTNKGEIKAHTVINAAGVYAHRVARMVGFHMPLKIICMTECETEPLGQHPFKPWFVGLSTAVPTVRGTIIVGGGGTHYDLGFDAFNDLQIWLPRLRNFRKMVNLRLDGAHLKRELVRVLSLSSESRRKAAFPTFVPKATIKGAEKAFRRLQELMPSLEEVKIAKISAGLEGLTPDMLPVIGELNKPKGFVMAAGWSGVGYALGPAVGHLLSEVIVDGKTSLPIDAFRPDRFAEGKLEMPSSGGYLNR